MFLLRLTMAAALAVVCLPVDISCAQIGMRNRVDFEIIADANGGLDDNQRWLEALSEVGADNVRIVQGSTLPGVEQIASASGTTYKVTGVLTNNKLILPKGRFGIRDTAKIKEYVESLRADGADVALAEKFAFGLTAEQLVELNTDLSRPLTETSVNKTPAQILQLVQNSIATPFVIDPAAAIALRDDYTLVDELNGLSHGTVLAASLRPLGLVLAPVREQGKTTEIRIVPSLSVTEFWPVGWPPEKRIDFAVPKLYEKIPVNIQNFSLTKTLPAIQKMMKIPFLYDYNSIAMGGIDMEKIRVSVQSDQMSFQIILSRIFSQSRGLKYEVRTDEAGTPFIWISGG
jgi:hypothetical protein